MTALQRLESEKPKRSEVGGDEFTQCGCCRHLRRLKDESHPTRSYDSQEGLPFLGNSSSAPPFQE
jgi:hypothetical protein